MIGADSVTKIIYMAVVLIALGINGFNDLKEHKTLSYVFLVAALVGIFLSGHPVICIALALSAWFLPDFHVFSMGAGDFEAAALVVSYLWSDSPYAIFFACIVGIVYWLIKGHRKNFNIPFVFCLFIGVILAILYLNLFYRT